MSIRRTYIALLLVLLVAHTAAASHFRRSAHPISGRYIVVLNNDVPKENIDVIARSLAAEHSGRVLGTMAHAIKAFGFEGPEASARALLNNPNVWWVEEDAEMHLSGEPSQFAFAQTMTPSPNAVTECPWQGSYYLCQYSNDQYWSLDRLDNLARIRPITPSEPNAKAYAYTTTGSTVRAYVIDTGIMKSHQEFRPGQVEKGFNMMWDTDVWQHHTRPDEEANFPVDTNDPDLPCPGFTNNLKTSHGTAVASALGGITTGSAKGVTLVPVKVASCSSPGRVSMLAVARGLDQVLADMQGRTTKRAVVSMSVYADTVRTDLSNPAYTYGQEVCEDKTHVNYVNCVSAIENEVVTLFRANIPVVASANNQGNANCTTSPARMGFGNGNPMPEHTITVGGTMYGTVNGTSYVDALWDCTGTVPCGYEWSPVWEPGSNKGACVSIFAPAWNIRVASMMGNDQYRDLGGASSGTSFSAPIVAGIIARLWDLHPTWTVTDIWNALAARANQRTIRTVLDPTTGNDKLVYMSAFE